MSKVLIIAEAGVNHNGSYELALRLIDAAKEAGADIVKFQTFVPELLMSKKAQKADYQKQTTGAEESQLEMIRKLSLGYDEFRALKTYCEKKGIQFLSTAFDLPSLDFLVELGINLFKIPSGEVTNLPYLKKIGSLKKQVILSTGMCTLEEISEAIVVLTEAGTPLTNITALHCNTEYPTPFSDVNLAAMKTISETFHIPTGYSDHTKGIEVPIAAVALGAVVIEKHFTLDRTMEGPDHKASLEPLELKQMVDSIRHIEQAIGNGTKEPSSSEKKNIAIARKSIHLNKDLKAGHILTENDLIMKRPGDGISPMKMDEVVGKKIKSDLNEDTKLNWTLLE
ncbi:MAG TPA: N-acetylneuraminate synthase [Cytophagaceae bacterium]|jgi:N-acetylneuraminate synthase|nr:N-acetylneuraminate synthase [Cytophagaceae bacterium]